MKLALRDDVEIVLSSVVLTIFLYLIVGVIAITVGRLNGITDWSKDVDALYYFGIPFGSLLVNVLRVIARKNKEINDGK